MCQTGIIILYPIKMYTQMKKHKKRYHIDLASEGRENFGRFAEISGVRTKEWVGLLLIG